ncbi:hypothetical protein EYF80_017059 [Liparis tanakae]|uniref:Uncharacterized protein n=1 Tax=Liparis tanakae TaxID=230148 RepID=A0A4Z2I5P1_9TELE|nr:hypothetical protein EYF80_017059 [Liparis tanakae]
MVTDKERWQVGALMVSRSESTHPRLHSRMAAVWYADVQTQVRPRAQQAASTDAYGPLLSADVETRLWKYEIDTIVRRSCGPLRRDAHLKKLPQLRMTPPLLTSPCPENRDLGRIKAEYFNLPVCAKGPGAARSHAAEPSTLPLSHPVGDSCSANESGDATLPCHRGRTASESISVVVGGKVTYDLLVNVRSM